MPKAYERREPFDDPVEEKKRLNAIKAKEARDRAKVKSLAVNEENRKIRKENKKLRKMLAQCKLIMKSHSNIKYPFESSDFDDSDSDMEMESNVQMAKKNTVSQQIRYDQIPEPVEINKEWGYHGGNDLGMETSQYFVKPIDQVAPPQIFSSGFSTGGPNVSQKIETPKATETIYERVSEPFTLENVITDDISSPTVDMIKNAPVIIDESYGNNGDSSSNVPEVQDTFETPTKTVSHQMDLKSVPASTIDRSAIRYNPNEINPPATNPEDLNQVDKTFDILQYRDNWNESPQIDLENVVSDDIDMILKHCDDIIDPNVWNDDSQIV